jgi:hypothetical protein
MDLEVMLALEETRPVLAFAGDWDDVLARAGERPGRRAPRPKVLALAAVVALAVATAIPAFALRDRLGSFFSIANSPQPTSRWELVGPSVPATGEVGAAARLTRIHLRTLRELVAGGNGYRRVALVAGIGEDGRPWVGQRGTGWASAFFPLFGDLTETDRAVWRTRTAHGWDGWQFPMYGRSDRGRTVFSYVAFGGEARASVDWATLVGFARSDVARVEVVTRSGVRHRLALRRGGGYTYTAVRTAALPSELRAFDADGRLIGRARFHLQPLDP